MQEGSKIYVEGQLQTREYTDRDGNQRKSTEVVLQRFRGELTLLDAKGGGGRDMDGDSDGGSSFGRSSPMQRTPDRRPATAGGGRMNDIIDDDIPF